MPRPTQIRGRREVAAATAGTDLLARVLESGCERLAVVSLHPGAGARTVVETLAGQLRERGRSLAVTSVPRIGLEGHDTDRANGLSLPEGVIVATAASVVGQSDALEPIEGADHESIVGEMRVCRVTRSSTVPVHGPDDPRVLEKVLGRLERHGDGLVLVDGAWERNGFAAPDVTRATLLSVAAGYSGTPERTAAALRYAVDILELGRYDVPVDRIFREASESRRAVAVDRNGQPLAEVVAGDPAAVPALELLGAQLTAVVLPEFLSDAFLTALVRSEVRCDLVVKDATRVRVSPVYFTAWLKGGGSVAVLQPMRLLAVTTNPSNATGLDADATEFRRLVADAIPGIPVHDVSLEVPHVEDRPRWKFWA